MKYRYLYQTKENENRDGWIFAKNRAEAYAALRKQGIRPYRLVGDDPVRWQPWAMSALVVALSAALVAALFLDVDGGAGREAAVRGQLVGDPAEIASGVAGGWADVFSSPLDRHLAAYAQPGWIALPPDAPPEAVAGFAAELEGPAAEPSDSDDATVRQLKGVVAAMRAEMREYLASGGTVRDYLAFLESRQDDESAYRAQALDSLRRTPDALRDKARINLNMRLRALGLQEIPE